MAGQLVVDMLVQVFIERVTNIIKEQLESSNNQKKSELTYQQHIRMN